MNKQQSASKGTGFFGLLTLVFITLKLLGVITWSWWWVLAPFWIPMGFLSGASGNPEYHQQLARK